MVGIYMDKLAKEIKYWSQILLLPVYGLSCIMPRDKKLWVFGSTFGNRFADNPKYFYLYLSQHKAEMIKVVWITKNREILELLRKNDLDCCYLYSWKGIWNALRAKVYLFDNYSKDICYTLSGGAVKINLWHGVPLKKIQKDNVFDYFRNPRDLMERIYSIPRRITDEKPNHYVLASSNYFKPIFASAFQTKRVLIEGYPRNDILISEDIQNVMTKQEARINRILMEQGRKNKIVTYMPTFRSSENKFFDIINIDQLCEFLKREHIYLCVKLHPKSKLQRSFEKLAADNVLVVNSQADPYGILKHTDILITDYSSICFDFMLTKKPIIFFPYDYKEYLAESRELYFDYHEFTPGRKVYNQMELECALLDENIENSNYQDISDKVFATKDPSASERLFHQVQGIIHK